MAIVILVAKRTRSKKKKHDPITKNEGSHMKNMVFPMQSNIFVACFWNVLYEIDGRRSILEALLIHNIAFPTALGMLVTLGDRHFGRETL